MVVTVEKDTTGEPALLLERSRAITLQGRAVVRIVGNYFPGKQRLRFRPDRKRFAVPWN